MRNTLIVVFSVMIFLGTGLQSFSQEIIDYNPEDAFLLPDEIGDFDETYTLKLAPGVYDMEEQVRFQNSTPTLEGSGSGLGPDATVLDFLTYSNSLEDSRAFSVRGSLTIRNLTILNAGGRALDLRTGNIGTLSSSPVIFENVWFINCQTVFKSTGGRTVGTPEAPMSVKNCVIAITSDYPTEFGNPSSAINLRDTSYATFDHCDFFNFNELIHLRIDDSDVAPNDGPGVTITNSILLNANGDDGTTSTDDLYVNAGTAILKNCVLWDLASSGELIKTGEGAIEYTDTVTADPKYVSVLLSLTNDSLDFNLLSDSPAIGLGSDSLNSGSIALEPVSILDWNLF